MTAAATMFFSFVKANIHTKNLTISIVQFRGPEDERAINTGIAANLQGQMVAMWYDFLSKIRTLAKLRQQIDMCSR